jgi:hypothetical protein
MRRRADRSKSAIEAISHRIARSPSVSAPSVPAPRLRSSTSAAGASSASRHITRQKTLHTFDVPSRRISKTSIYLSRPVDDDRDRSRSQRTGSSAPNFRDVAGARFHTGIPRVFLPVAERPGELNAPEPRSVWRRDLPCELLSSTFKAALLLWRQGVDPSRLLPHLAKLDEQGWRGARPGA